MKKSLILIISILVMSLFLACTPIEENYELLKESNNEDLKKENPFNIIEEEYKTIMDQPVYYSKFNFNSKEFELLGAKYNSLEEIQNQIEFEFNNFVDFDNLNEIGNVKIYSKDEFHFFIAIEDLILFIIPNDDYSNLHNLEDLVLIAENFDYLISDIEFSSVQNQPKEVICSIQTGMKIDCNSIEKENIDLELENRFGKNMIISYVQFKQNGNIVCEFNELGLLLDKESINILGSCPNLIKSSNDRYDIDLDISYYIEEVGEDYSTIATGKIIY
jgi:hypothetical protein